MNTREKIVAGSGATAADRNAPDAGANDIDAAAEGLADFNFRLDVPPRLEWHRFGRGVPVSPMAAPASAVRARETTRWTKGLGR